MKKFVIAFLVALTAAVSQASYLYWEIGSDQVQSIAGDGWTNAKFYQVDGTTKTQLNLFGDDGETVTQMPNLAGNDTKGFGGPIGVDLGSIEAATCGYSYYIELVNSTGNLVGYTQGTYASLAQDGYVLTEKMTPTEVVSTSVWHGPSAYNAPEPTSAVLMMLGVAGLALRRKQRKLA